MYPSMLLRWWCHGINWHIGGNCLRLQSFLSWIDLEVRTNKFADSGQLCTSTTLPTGCTIGPFTWSLHDIRKNCVVMDGTYLLELGIVWRRVNNCPLPGNNNIPSTGNVGTVTLALLEDFEWRPEVCPSLAVGAIMCVDRRNMYANRRKY